MDSLQGEDLGYGAFVSPATGSELVVASRELALGWLVRSRTGPGTAVLWREDAYEVISRSPLGDGDRWVLRAWVETSAMRNVVRLDAEKIRSIHQRVVEERRGRRVRRAAVWFLPILGLAPARLQKAWEQAWAYPSDLATWISALTWMFLGGVGVTQLAALAFGGDYFLPPWMRWLMWVGSYLVVEGSVRLILLAADGEPAGSVLGLPLWWIRTRPRPQPPPDVPVVRSFDDERGVLELVSPIYRADWNVDAVLSYRGREYQLIGSAQEGRDWIYRFNRSFTTDPGVLNIRLRPPVSRVAPPGADAGLPSLLETGLISAAITLGPGEDQKIWGRHLNTSPIWFTLIGASSEIIGGFVNLRSGGGGSAPWVILINLFVIGEGLLRFGSGIGGRPMGSVFGWLLRPLYRARLPL